MLRILRYGSPQTGFQGSENNMFRSFDMRLKSLTAIFPEKFQSCRIVLTVIIGILIRSKGISREVEKQLRCITGLRVRGSLVTSSSMRQSNRASLPSDKPHLSADGAHPMPTFLISPCIRAAEANFKAQTLESRKSYSICRRHLRFICVNDTEINVTTSYYFRHLA